MYNYFLDKIKKFVIKATDISSLEDKVVALNKELESIRNEVKENAIYSLSLSLDANLSNNITSNIKCPICNENIETPNKYIKLSNNFWNTNTITRIECPYCDVIFGPLSVINREPKRLSEDYKMLYRYYQEGNTKFNQRLALEK